MNLLVLVLCGGNGRVARPGPTSSFVLVCDLDHLFACMFSRASSSNPPKCRIQDPSLHFQNVPLPNLCTRATSSIDNVQRRQPRNGFVASGVELNVLVHVSLMNKLGCSYDFLANTTMHPNIQMSLYKLSRGTN